MNGANYELQAAQIFTVMFIMLGPFRLLGQVSNFMVHLGPSKRVQMSVKVGIISTLALLIGGYVGSLLLANWHVQTEILMLAAGIIFFVMALKPLTQSTPKDLNLSDSTSPVDMALRIIISPYGMATVIVLIAVSHDFKRTLVIAGCVVIIMLLNILILAFSKMKPNSNFSLITKIITAGMGTLQLALALQIINNALTDLKIIE